MQVPYFSLKEGYIFNSQKERNGPIQEDMGLLTIAEIPYIGCRIFCILGGGQIRFSMWAEEGKPEVAYGYPGGRDVTGVVPVRALPPSAPQIYTDVRTTSWFVRKVKSIDEPTYQPFKKDCLSLFYCKKSRKKAPMKQ